MIMFVFQGTKINIEFLQKNGTKKNWGANIENEFQPPLPLLPPASAVEVIESEPFVCVSVCLSALSRLNRLTYDLDFWHGS